MAKHRGWPGRPASGLILLAAFFGVAGPVQASIVGVTATADTAVAAGAMQATNFPAAPSLFATASSDQLVHSVLHDGNVLYTGVTFQRIEIEVPSAGQLTILLKDMAFPGGPGSLLFALVDGGSVLGKIDGSGSLEYDVTGPRTLYAYVFGVADAATNSSSYYLNIVHDGVPTVPLPPSAILLLSGLALAATRMKRRRSAGLAGGLPAAA
jgi:hypothetical protein